MILWLRLTLLVCVGTLLTACAAQSGVEIVRGTPPLDRAPVASVTAENFTSGHFTAADGSQLPYRLLVPSQIKAGRRYPLVVQFHNSGAIGSDNRAQIERDVSARAWAAPAIRMRYPAFVLVPQFAMRSANYDNPKMPRNAYATTQLDTALALVDAIAREQPIDPDRIYATGFSMGGSTAWLAAIARPSLFAAIVPVSGIAPDRSHASALTELPLLVLHGDADSENPIESDREMVAAIRASGGRQIHLREYVGLEHEPPGDLIPGARWRDWLFEQHRGERDQPDARLPDTHLGTGHRQGQALQRRHAGHGDQGQVAAQPKDGP